MLKLLSRRAYSHIEIVKSGSLSTLVFNRPKKYNAIHGEMYTEIADALTEISKDDNCSMAAITGRGKFYSSGNDISNFLHVYGFLSH